MATKTLVSLEEYLRIDESDGGPRYELDEGELVEMSSATPLHVRFQIALSTRIENYTGERWPGGLFTNTDFLLAEDLVRCPDLAVVRPERMRDFAWKRVPIPFAPDLAVEVVSPSESALALDRKISQYLGAGTEEVWTIFTDETIHAYTHTRDTVRRVSADEPLTTPIVPGFSVKLADLAPPGFSEKKSSSPR